MRAFIPLLVSALILFASFLPMSVQAEPDAELFADSRAALANFHRFPQVQPFFEKAYGYAVFPTVGKGGFWVGGLMAMGWFIKAIAPLPKPNLSNSRLALPLAGKHSVKSCSLRTKPPLTALCQAVLS